MATRSRTPRPRTRPRTATTRAGRFGRTPQQAASGRWPVRARARKQQQKSGVSKALPAVGGAVVTAAAGLALKNRDKLASAVGRRRGGEPAPPVPPVPPGERLP